MGNLLRKRWALVVLGVVTLAVVLLPSVATGQSRALPMIDDTDRRVILVPGIIFTKELDPSINQGPVNTCYRAINETFPVIHKLLTEPEARNGKLYAWPDIWATMPVYQRDQIYAFDYYSKTVDLNLPCDRYPGDGIDAPLPEEGKFNNNSYSGDDTRTSLTDSFPEEERRRWWDIIVPPAYGPSAELKGTPERFALQFKQWRKECPDCHFDIIAHSLGGAVVSYWISAFADDDDLKHVHSIVTVDSPINGIDKFLIDIHPFTLRFIEDWNAAGGLVPQNLRDPDFIRRMRSAPYRVDMLCVSNLFDALIPPQAATLRYSGEGLFYLSLREKVTSTSNMTWFAPGPCENPIGIFSFDDPYRQGFDLLSFDAKKREQAHSVLVETVGRAHGQPTSDAWALRFVMRQVARDPARWWRANRFLEAWLERTPRSRITTPGTRTTVDIVLRNAGTAVWRPGQVSLEQVGGTSFKLNRTQPLSQVVRPGEAITLTMSFDAPAERGAYPSRWQLRRGTNYFGPEVVFGVVVIPPSEIDPEVALDNPIEVLRALADQFVTDTQDRIQEEIDKWVAELQRQIIEQFWRAVCGVVPAIVVVGSGTAAWRIRRRRPSHEERSDER